MVFIRSALSVHFFPRLVLLYFISYHGEIATIFLRRIALKKLTVSISLFLFCLIRFLQCSVDTSIFLHDGKIYVAL